MYKEQKAKKKTTKKRVVDFRIIETLHNTLIHHGFNNSTIMR